ncbi:hypothetical protein EVAR_80156_1 [Eumeta japonica]|uniref:Uncharacterized protein n=1 Tax=Eumeta variegata TaxID=151549 RepID=A0A4C1YBI8_EUMVA|nr:hypothetical protein EVAR_80156_1 [Eumeta japonica]
MPNEKALERLQGIWNEIRAYVPPSEVVHMPHMRTEVKQQHNGNPIGNQVAVTARGRDLLHARTSSHLDAPPCGALSVPTDITMRVNVVRVNR